MQILLLILFGAAGTLARYALQGLVQQRVGTGFPAGTMVVNLLGCFLMGMVARYCFQHLWVPPEWRVGLLLGFFGAFTTFSAFGWETVRMLEQAEWLQTSLYVLTSVLGGVVAVMLGIKLADLL